MVEYSRDDKGQIQMSRERYKLERQLIKLVRSGAIIIKVEGNQFIIQSQSGTNIIVERNPA